MKSKNYRNSKLKHQILYEKDKGKKTLYWKLTTEQRKYVEQVLKCKVKPYLYEIRTRTFFNISKLDSILKDIHFLVTAFYKLFYKKYLKNNLKIDKHIII